MSEPRYLGRPDLAGAPLVGLEPGAEFHATNIWCDLCRDRPGTLVLGFHPGTFCESCMAIIDDGSQVTREGGCRCPVWTEREQWLSLCSINIGIRETYDDPDEWVAIWKCPEGVS